MRSPWVWFGVKCLRTRAMSIGKMMTWEPDEIGLISTLKTRSDIWHTHKLIHLPLPKLSHSDKIVSKWAEEGETIVEDDEIIENDSVGDDSAIGIAEVMAEVLNLKEGQENVWRNAGRVTLVLPWTFSWAIQQWTSTIKTGGERNKRKCIETNGIPWKTSFGMTGVGQVWHFEGPVTVL